MPRYHFHRTDGQIEPDPEGSVLPDLHAARMQAVVYAGQTLKDHPEMVWDGHDLNIEVTDDTGLMLFVVTVMTIEAPATHDN